MGFDGKLEWCFGGGLNEAVDLASQREVSQLVEHQNSGQEGGIYTSRVEQKVYILDKRWTHRSGIFGIRSLTRTRRRCRHGDI